MKTQKLAVIDICNINYEIWFSIRDKMNFVSVEFNISENYILEMCFNSLLAKIFQFFKYCWPY